MSNKKIRLAEVTTLLLWMAMAYTPLEMTQISESMATSCSIGRLLQEPSFAVWRHSNRPNVSTTSTTVPLEMLHVNTSMFISWPYSTSSIGAVTCCLKIYQQTKRLYRADNGANDWIFFYNNIAMVSMEAVLITASCITWDYLLSIVCGGWFLYLCAAFLGTTFSHLS